MENSFRSMRAAIILIVQTASVETSLGCLVCALVLTPGGKKRIQKKLNQDGRQFVFSGLVRLTNSQVNLTRPC